MKFFALLMSILLMGLSNLPCNDRAEVVDGQSCVAETHQDGTSSHSDSADDCSPFCYCACCAASSLSNNNPGNTIISVPAATAFNPMGCEKVIAVSLPVWQPPQI